MENITLDRTAVLQLDADGTDRALDAAADRDVLRDDAALDLCAIAAAKGSKSAAVRARPGRHTTGNAEARRDP